MRNFGVVDFKQKFVACFCLLAWFVRSVAASLIHFGCAPSDID